jgi:hypothetical protein
MLSIKTLVQSVQLGLSPAILYTTSKTSGVIKKATAVNTSETDAMINVNLVPNGGVPDNTNVVIQERTIAAGKTADLFELANHVLDSGGATIQAFSDTDAVIVLRVSGYEIG